jgi:hypothetical protein
MRVLFIALVVLNLALAGYALLPAGKAPDAHLSQQLNAEQIHIVAPAVLPTGQATCLQWGNFGESEFESVRRGLAGVSPPIAASEVKVPVVAGWWVYIPPLRDRAEVDRKLLELQALGVKEYYAVEAEGAMRNAISLGIFKSEASARAFLAGLQDKGVRSAKLGSREHRVTQLAVLVRNADAQTSANLADLALRFPGSELRTVDCP